MTGLKRWWSGIPGLVASWWNVDRIRLPADEGLWLRLPVGSFIEREGVMFEVVACEPLGSSEESLVGYRCVAGSQTARLLVTPGSPPWTLTGDLSPQSLDDPNPFRSLRLLWEDREGINVIAPGELTAWPINQRLGWKSLFFDPKRM